MTSTGLIVGSLLKLSHEPIVSGAAALGVRAIPAAWNGLGPHACRESRELWSDPRCATWQPETVRQSRRSLKSMPTSALERGVRHDGLGGSLRSSPVAALARAP